MKTWSIVLALSLAPTLAAAEPLEVERYGTLAGKNELSAELGFQGSLGGSTPAGAKLFFDYARYLGRRYVWLDFKLNPTFPVEGRATCVDGAGNAYDCGYGIGGNGYALEALAGVKLKFPLRRFHLVPFANLNVGGVGIFSRPGNDDGGAVVFRTGGGLRWFITPHVAIGGEANLTLGGAFYSESCAGCNDGHTELYRSLDMSFGAELIL